MDLIVSWIVAHEAACVGSVVQKIVWMYEIRSCGHQVRGIIWMIIHLYFAGIQLIHFPDATYYAQRLKCELAYDHRTPTKAREDECQGILIAQIFKRNALIARRKGEV